MLSHHAPAGSHWPFNPIDSHYCTGRSRPAERMAPIVNTSASATTSRRKGLFLAMGDIVHRHLDTSATTRHAKCSHRNPANVPPGCVLRTRLPEDGTSSFQQEWLEPFPQSDPATFRPASSLIPGSRPIYAGHLGLIRARGPPSRMFYSSNVEYRGRRRRSVQGGPLSPELGDRAGLRAKPCCQAGNTPALSLATVERMSRARTSRNAKNCPSVRAAGARSQCRR
jgi:hypothetical protein